MREGTTVSRTVGGVTDGEQYAVNTENMSKEHQAYTTARCLQYIARFQASQKDSRPFSYRFILGGDSLEGQLVNSRVPKWQFVYVCHFSVKHLRMCSA